MDKLTAHISYREATNSPTAKRLGITNEPEPEDWARMEVVASKCFEPARVHFDKPIFINSFFRSTTLNKSIGGSSTSDHCYGRAMDIDTKGQEDFSNKDLFEFLKDHVEFDQLIWEFGNDQEPDWIHVSHREGNNRGQVLVAYRSNGKTAYKIYE